MQPPRNYRERGVGLLVTLIAIATLTVVGLALTTTGQISFMISSNEEEAIGAAYIAEAGLTHARQLITASGSSDYTAMLQAGNGTACDGDELSTEPTDPITANGHAFAGGQYEVSICDDANDGDGDENADDNGLVRVVSVGTGGDGAMATLQLTLGLQDLPGFLVDGNLEINGNPTISGNGGSVHSNGSLKLTGNPCAHLYFSGGNLVDSNGDPVTDPSTLNAETGSSCSETGANLDVRDDAAGLTIPVIDFQALYDAATYILENDGAITQVSTGLDVTATLSEWSWSAGNLEWSLSGNSITQGTYYADDSNIKISGGPGSNNDPASVTLIADGYIDISGNPDFIPNLTLNGAVYSMIAGTDLGLSGNVGTAGAAQGLHYAHHQIKFNGNPTIYGQVLVANAADTPIYGSNNLAQLDGNGFMQVSGNVSITYNGGGSFGSLLVTGWREVRN